MIEWMYNPNQWHLLPALGFDIEYKFVFVGWMCWGVLFKWGG